MYLPWQPPLFPYHSNFIVFIWEPCPIICISHSVDSLLWSFESDELSLGYLMRVSISSFIQFLLLLKVESFMQKVHASYRFAFPQPLKAIQDTEMEVLLSWAYIMKRYNQSIDFRKHLRDHSNRAVETQIVYSPSKINCIGRAWFRIRYKCDRPVWNSVVID
jgi:hypothetical protein